MRPTLRGLGRALALAAAQLAAVLALLEIAGRGFDPLGVSYYPETARYLDTLVLEEPIAYRNRPGLEGRFYGAAVRINALGMRDREVGPKAPGEYRILVLGDSVPFGIGVSYEDSLPHQLEQRLQAGHPGRRVRTLNLGVPSYNTEQQLIQLNGLGLRLEPDAAILLFSSNDIEPKRWVLDRRGRWYADLAQRSYAASLLYVLAREVRRRVAPIASAHAGGIAGLNAPLVSMDGYRTDDPRWQAVERALSEMNRVLRAAGVPLVLFALGEGPPILPLLEAVARREGIAFYNLKRREDPRWSGMDERLFRNSAIDGHPSALGNAALATLVAESLAHAGVLPRN